MDTILGSNPTTSQISLMIGFSMLLGSTIYTLHRSLFYYKEHGVPHFHAKYAGQTGVFSIVDLKLIEGRLPKRVIALVLEWAFEHRSELMENWQRAVAQEPLQPIPPLE